MSTEQGQISGNDSADLNIVHGIESVNYPSKGDVATYGEEGIIWSPPSEQTLLLQAQRQVRYLKGKLAEATERVYDLETAIRKSERPQQLSIDDKGE